MVDGINRGRVDDAVNDRLGARTSPSSLGNVVVSVGFTAIMADLAHQNHRLEAGVNNKK